MGLEILLKACWRHRRRLLIGAVVGAIIVAGVGSLLVSKKYVSTTDIAVAAVFPSSDVDSSGNAAAYSLQPDRFVSTQVEIISSEAAAARVAGELHLGTDAVRRAVTVAQLGKSDVIRVTTSSASPGISADIAQHLADNYVAGVGVDTQGQYKLAVASVDSQLASVATQITAGRAELAKSVVRPALNDPLQQQLLELQTQNSQLTVQRQHLLVQSRTATTSTRVVSRAVADSSPVGIGTTSLAAYGAVLGLAIMLCSVALTTTPGRAVELDGSGDLDGVPILGVLNPVPRGQKLPGIAHAAEQAYVRNLRVAGELSRIIQLKGPVVVAVAGGARSVQHVEKLLGPLLGKHDRTSQQAVDTGGWEMPALALAEVSGSLAAGATTATATHVTVAENLVTVMPLVSLLQQRPPEQVVVLAVDTERVKRVEVDEVLASLRTFGADILGVIGIR